MVGCSRLAVCLQFLYILILVYYQSPGPQIARTSGPAPNSQAPHPQSAGNIWGYSIDFLMNLSLTNTFK